MTNKRSTSRRSDTPKRTSRAPARTHPQAGRKKVTFPLPVKRSGKTASRLFNAVRPSHDGKGGSVARSRRPGKILVGTASWSDPGFVKDWYPPKLPARERLAWYAE